MDMNSKQKLLSLSQEKDKLYINRSDIGSEYQFIKPNIMPINFKTTPCRTLYKRSQYSWDGLIIFLTIFLVLDRGLIFALDASSLGGDSPAGSSRGGALEAPPRGGGDPISAARCRVRCLARLEQELEEKPWLYSRSGGGSGRSGEGALDDAASEFETLLSPPLSSLSSSSSSSSSHSHHAVSLLRCREDITCESCLRPCNLPFHGVNLCQESCRVPFRDEICEESCRFLNQINTIRPGTCPPETRATGYAALCVHGCVTDADCDSSLHLKCCSNSCGWTCQQPNHIYDGMPDVPGQPVVRERGRGGGVEVVWTSVGTNSSGPVIYLIDARYHVGMIANERDMSEWRQVSQTTDTSTHIDDLKPGHWYQYRVSAVNVYGSQGASKPTAPFSLHREPRKPGAPVNLTEGDTLIMGGKVAVSLRWLPPKEADLPVSRYKVTWSRRLKSGEGGGRQAPAGGAVREQRQVIPGDKLYFQIPNLEPDTTYFVQVHAICQYGEVKLKSDKASILISTYPLPHILTPADEGLIHGPPQSSISRLLPPVSLQPPPVENLSVSGAYFHEGVLKANVSWSLSEDTLADEDWLEVDRYLVHWSAEACIADELPDNGLSRPLKLETSERRASIYELRFDCRYTVTVDSVGMDGTQGEARQVGLSTPSCRHVQVIGRTKPQCSHSAKQVPDKPNDLRHSFIISNANITAQITWTSPTTLDTPITAYRVIWGPQQTTPTGPEMVNPFHQSRISSSSSSTAGSNTQHHSVVINKTTSLTKVLDKDATSLNIDGLAERTTYVADVQALSSVGPGRVASIQFTTPLLQSNSHLDHPQYRQINGQSHTDRDLRNEPKRRAELITYAVTIPAFMPTRGLEQTAMRNKGRVNQASRLHHSTLYLVIFSSLLTLRSFRISHSRDYRIV